jgi:hypothetical protein
MYNVRLEARIGGSQVFRSRTDQDQWRISVVLVSGQFWSRVNLSGREQDYVCCSDCCSHVRFASYCSADRHVRVLWSLCFSLNLMEWHVILTFVLGINETVLVASYVVE